MSLFSSVRNVTTLLFAGCILLAAAGPLAGQKADDENNALPENKGYWATVPQRKVPPGADELLRLRIARYNAALEELQALDQQMLAGRILKEFALDAGDRLRESALALCNTPAERILVLQQAVDYGKDMEKIAEAKLDAGTVSVADYAMVRYWRLDAEIRLLQEKGKK